MAIKWRLIALNAPLVLPYQSGKDAPELSTAQKKGNCQMPRNRTKTASDRSQGKRGSLPRQDCDASQERTERSVEIMEIIGNAKIIPDPARIFKSGNF